MFLFRSTFSYENQVHNRVSLVHRVTCDSITSSWLSFQVSWASEYSESSWDSGHFPPPSPATSSWYTVCTFYDSPLPQVKFWCYLLVLLMVIHAFTCITKQLTAITLPLSIKFFAPEHWRTRNISFIQFCANDWLYLFFAGIFSRHGANIYLSSLSFFLFQRCNEQRQVTATHCTLWLRRSVVYHVLFITRICVYIINNVK